ncbi:MAG: DUF4956 domain-containing protein [Candidatus Kryptonium sp.]
MLQDFQNISFGFTFDDVIRNLFVSFLCGFIVSIFYRLSYRGISYSSVFVSSLIALSMITAMVIMVIGNNLARAFGLVGAMSIIRFRTAIKDTQDIVFIFFVLAVGMASGVGFHIIALVGALLVGSIILLLSKLNYGVVKRKDYLVQFTYGGTSGEESSLYLDVLRKHCRTFNLVNIRSISSDKIEISYHVRLKDKSRIKEFIYELGQVKGVSGINFYSDEGEI